MENVSNENSLLSGVCAVVVGELQLSSLQSVDAIAEVALFVLDQEHSVRIDWSVVEVPVVPEVHSLVFDIVRPARRLDLFFMGWRITIDFVSWTKRNRRSIEIISGEY